MSEQPKRRGRPPKQKIQVKQEKYGIVGAPSNEGVDPNYVNVVEMIYGNPMSIKKLFKLFKAEKSKSIIMKFDKEMVEIVARVELKDGNKGKGVSFDKIYTTIKCDRVGLYYCKEPMTVEINDSLGVQSLLEKINKEISSVSFSIMYGTRFSKMNISLNTEFGCSRSEFEIAPVEVSLSSLEENLAEQVNFPISFELCSKFFKKYISDASSMANTMTIYKNGVNPLTFEFTSKNNNFKQTFPMKSENDIKLETSIEENDIFAVTFYLSHLKPSSSAVIADTISISLREDGDSIFSFSLDVGEHGSTCNVYVFNKPVDLKK